MPLSSERKTAPAGRPETSPVGFSPPELIARTCSAAMLYPAGHPARASAVGQLHRNLTNCLAAGELRYAITRHGFAHIGDGRPSGSSVASQEFARELLQRGIRQLDLLPGLTASELNSFIQLMTIPTEQVIAAGGMTTFLRQSGCERIRFVELDPVLVMHQNDAAAVAEPVLPVPPRDSLTTGPEPSLDELVRMLNGEFINDRYRSLAGILLERAEPYRARSDHGQLVPVLAALAGHLEDPRRSLSQQECARETLGRLVTGSLLDHLMNLHGSGSGELVRPILQGALPAIVVDLVGWLHRSGDAAVRQAIAGLLAAAGPAAIPAVAGLVTGSDRQLARTGVTVLGEIAAAAGVPHLLVAARHPDDGMRREAARALGRCGGYQSESALIGMLDDPVPAVVRQAVSSLAAIGSRTMVVKLQSIISRRDPLLRSLPIKLAAVQALGRLGEEVAIPSLIAILAKRPFLVRGKWETLQAAAARALGQLGDQQALPLLERLAERNCTLGIACREACSLLTTPSDKE